MKRLLYLFIALFAAAAVIQAAETPISKGKDFWFSFPPNYHNSYSSDDSLYVFITSVVPTTGNIQVRNINGTVSNHPFTITDPLKMFTFSVNYFYYELRGFNIANGDTYTNQGETVAKQYFHITSNDDVTVYALSSASMTSDAMLVLPTKVLGKDYLVMSFSSDGRGSSEISFTPSQFHIVATENNTTVDISPSAATYIYGVIPQQVILNQGDSYLVQALVNTTNSFLDLTGSSVRSDKPIVVFGSQQRATVPKITNAGLNPSRDILLEQIPSLNFWGVNAFLIPFSASSYEENRYKDMFRILSANDDTKIYINGALKTTLDKGKFYEDSLVIAATVTSDKPILVAQFRRTSGYGSSIEGIGDPFMLIVPPVEQYLKNCRVINAQKYDFLGGLFTEQYITIVAKTSALATTLLDRTAIPDSCFTSIPNSLYSYANIDVADGVHDIESSDPMQVYVYGYGTANSYGYLGGMNFDPKDFNAPDIEYSINCYELTGSVTEKRNFDSGLETVYLKGTSSENVVVDIDPIVNSDSIRFNAQLIDQYKDGKFTIYAKDSAGFVSEKEIIIPGYTIRVVGPDPLIIVKTLRYTLNGGSTINGKIALENIGSAQQKIVSINHINSNFSYDYNVPKTIDAAGTDSIKFVFTNPDGQTIYVDTVYIVTECGRYMACIIIVEVKQATDCISLFFDYPKFDPLDNLALVDDAQYDSEYILLTASKANQRAAVWYKNPVALDSGFVAFFTFSLRYGVSNGLSDGSEPGADGVAFVITGNSPDIGFNGAGIGYDGIVNSLAVEFDTFKNDSTQIHNYYDPNGNHVAVQCNGVDSNTSKHILGVNLGINTDIITMRADGTKYNAKIEYLSSQKRLSVYLDTTSKFEKAALVLEQFDLPRLLNLIDGKEAFVAITSSTGYCYENQRLESWKMCRKYVPVNDVEDNAGNESGYVKVYPNPVSIDGFVEIKTVKNAIIDVSLNDQTGNKVMNLTSGFCPADVYKIPFNTSKLAQGSYFLIVNIDGKSEVYPVVVVK